MGGFTSFSTAMFDFIQMKLYKRPPGVALNHVL